MIDRIVAGVAAALVALSGGAVAPAPGPSVAGDNLWPYPRGCVNVTLADTRGVYRPDSTTWLPWFDATVRGRATPCRRGAGEATLAVTQYHVRDGATVGLMSTPWRTAARGATPFSRFGRIEPDVAALCISTGLTRRAAAVVARNAVCVRPQRRGNDHLVTRFTPVALTDPLVGAALIEYPTGGAASAGPRCAVDCLASPYRTYRWPRRTTSDTPTARPTVPLQPYEPICHTLSISDAFAGPSDDDVNGFDVWLTGGLELCDRDSQLPSLHAIRYWGDRGVVMPIWDPTQDPLVKGAQVNENTRALCVASGMRQRGGRLYGVHQLCWRIEKVQRDAYRLVPIRTDDPGVRKPLISNIPEPEPSGWPKDPCASCL